MFHFTIRELVLVTVIVAISAGWLADHWHMANALEDANHPAREMWFRLAKLESAIYG
jgi:hypothetical protein